MAGTTGLAPKDQVVCYDAGNGSMAARLWWMLRWIGHDKVAVLDGGFAQWVKEGRPTTIDVPIFTPFNYPIKLRKDMAVDAAALQKGRGKHIACSTPARRRAFAASRSRSIRSRAAFPAQEPLQHRQPCNRRAPSRPPRS